MITSLTQTILIKKIYHYFNINVNDDSILAKYDDRLFLSILITSLVGYFIQHALMLSFLSQFSGLILLITFFRFEYFKLFFNICIENLVNLSL